MVERYVVHVRAAAVLLAAMAMLSAVSLGAHAASGEPDIAIGDTISVKVYGEPDLNVDATRVQRVGTIAVPLIGDVRVLSRTPAEVKDEITARFADGYLKKPSVTVHVDRVQLYYIKGEIRRPGGYRYVEGLSVEKAIVLAGGFTERAAEDDISVFSEKSPDRIRSPVSPRAKVSVGDVITIGKSFF